MNDTGCAGTTQDGYSCFKTGKYEENGKRWCGTHRPSAVEAKRQAWRSKFDRKWKAQQDAQRAADQRAVELSADLKMTVITRQRFTNKVVGWDMILAEEFIPYTEPE